MTHRKKPELTLNLLQIIISVLLTITLISLVILSLTSANRSVKFSNQSQTAISQLEAATEVKREIFVYDIGFGQWTTGHIPLSTLMGSRTTLLRSLGVTKDSGTTMAHIGDRKLADLLQGADLLIKEAGPGFLSISLQDKFLLTSLQILNGLTSVARSFDAPYAAAVNSQIIGNARAARTTARWSLIRFLIWVGITLFFLFWIATSFRRRHKKTQKEMLASKQNLDMVREELTEAHETVLALEKIDKSRSDFVATINHELRTPLTSIIGYLDILKDFTATENDREFHKYLGVMDRNALVLYQLIESILFLSALANQESLSDPLLIDLVDLCEAAIADQVLAIKSAHIKVRTHYQEGEYYSVLGNKALLTQVFTNLISNAVKFSPEKSRIDLSFTRYESEDGNKLIRVEVKDQGIGIPPEELPQLFTRFFRASNAIGSEIPGTGLGLSIVQRIVQLHQGTVSVHSVVGEGTLMTVEIPFAISPLEELVMGKREAVLQRAITAISESSMEELIGITHDVGGAIGFYTFEEESAKLIQFSRWLEKNPETQSETISKKKVAILELLNHTLDQVQNGRVASGE
jgi:signal transduction histidine kinase